jgi:hypothetical protein
LAAHSVKSPGPIPMSQSGYGISGKWLELLKEIAPNVTRAAVIRDPTIGSGIGQFDAIQTVAPSLGVEVNPVNVRDASEIERAIAAIDRPFVASGGLISYGPDQINQYRQAAGAAFSRVRSQPICRSCSRPNSSWPSTSRLQEHSTSRRRPDYSPSPTR